MTMEQAQALVPGDYVLIRAGGCVQFGKVDRVELDFRFYGQKPKEYRRVWFWYQPERHPLNYSSRHHDHCERIDVSDVPVRKRIGEVRI